MAEYLELVQGFAEKMSKPTTIVQVVNSMVRANKAQFDIVADSAALADPQRLHHVYEWGELGKPKGRLWDFVVGGVGGSKELYYVFKASKKTVPTSDLPGDTRNKVHVFSWKAPVMEAGDPLTVYPSEDKGILVFPRGQHGANLPHLNDDMDFSRAPVHIMHPGGQSKGQFGALWEAYWSTWGDRIMVEDIVDVSNDIIRTKFPMLVDSISRSRVSERSGIHINTIPRQNMYSRGEGLVDDMLNGYLNAARQRERIAGVEYDSNI